MDKTRKELTLDCKDTYMITISCSQCKDYISPSHLGEVISYLKLCIDSLQILDYSYENSGKYKQLHYHALALVAPRFRYKRYSKFGAKHITGNTYQIYWKKVYNTKKALSYIYKDQRYKTQDEILLDNYYSINRFNELYLT